MVMWPSLDGNYIVLDWDFFFWLAMITNYNNLIVGLITPPTPPNGTTL